MNDIEKTRRFLASPLLRRVFPILFILLYVIGMVLMLAFQRFDQGLILWFVSTVCGAILLYAKRKQEKKLEDLLQEEAEEAAYQARVRAQNQEQN